MGVGCVGVSVRGGWWVWGGVSVGVWVWGVCALMHPATLRPSWVSYHPDPPDTVLLETLRARSRESLVPSPGRRLGFWVPGCGWQLPTIPSWGSIKLLERLSELRSRFSHRIAGFLGKDTAPERKTEDVQGEGWRRGAEVPPAPRKLSGHPLLGF